MRLLYIENDIVVFAQIKMTFPMGHVYKACVYA